jgi:hypothetical protein
MVAIRSASKAAAGPPRIRLAGGKKTPRTQDNRGAGAAPGAGDEATRAPGAGLAAEEPAAPVILWDDPVDSGTNADRGT